MEDFWGKIKIYLMDFPYVILANVMFHKKYPSR